MIPALDGSVSVSEVYGQSVKCNHLVSHRIAGWPRHRENRESGSQFFQTGKTQEILL